MANDVGIEITIDPRPAEKGVGAVEQLLESLLASGTKAGDGIGKSIGDSIAGGAARAKGPLVELDRELERQLAIIDRIRAPLQQYEQGLADLDTLAKSGAITTAEWSREVTRLNRAFDSAVPALESYNREAAKSANAKQAAATIGLSAPKGGEGGGGGAGGGAGGAVFGVATAFAGSMLASVASIDGIANAFQSLIDKQDHMIEISNQLQKYAGETGNTNALMADQKRIAVDLRASLDDVVPAYVAARDASAALYLTHKQQLGLTTNLGAAMKLEGKAIGDSTTIMSQLEYAVSTNNISQLQLHTLMRDNSEIADVWTASFGRTRDQLEGMAANGTLDVKKLVESLAEADQLRERLSKRQMTSTDYDNVNAASGEVSFWGYDTDKIKARLLREQEQARVAKGQAFADKMGFGAQYKEQVQLDTWEGQIDKVEMLEQGYRRAADATHEYTDRVQKLRDQGTGTALAESRKTVDDIIAGVSKSTAAVSVFANELKKAQTNNGPDRGRIAHDLGDQVEIATQKASNALLTYGAAVDTVALAEIARKQSIRDYTAAMAAGKITTVQYAAAMSTLASGPLEKLEAQFRNNTAAAKESFAALQASAGAAPGLIEQLRLASQLAGNAAVTQGMSYGDVVQEYRDARDRKVQRRQHLKDAVRAGDLPASWGSKELGSMSEGTNEYGDMLKRILGPQKEFDKGIKLVNRALGDSKISLQQYNDEVDRLYQSIGSKSPREILAKLGGDISAFAAGAQVAWSARAAAEFDANAQRGRDIRAAMDVAPVDAYRLAVEELKRVWDQGEVSQGEYDDALTKIQASYRDATTASEEYRASQARTDRSAAAYAQKQQIYASAPGSKKTPGISFGIQGDIDEYQKQIDDFGRHYQKVQEITGQVVGGVFDALDETAKSADASWRTLTETVLNSLAQIARAAAQQALINGIVKMIGPTIGAPSGIKMAGGEGDWVDHLTRTSPSGGGNGARTSGARTSDGIVIQLVEQSDARRREIISTTGSRAGERQIIKTVNRNRGAFSPRK